jgi:hypothetical protein
MTKAMRNYGILAIALIAFTLSFSTVKANEEGPKKTVTELKYVGKVENQPVFQLDLNNTEEEEFTITFRDEYGNIIYSDKFTGANITKKFLFNDELAEAHLNVVVRSKKRNTTEVYTINKSTSYVEETVVNKIK